MSPMSQCHLQELVAVCSSHLLAPHQFCPWSSFTSVQHWSHSETQIQLPFPCCWLATVDGHLPNTRTNGSEVGLFPLSDHYSFPSRLEFLHQLWLTRANETKSLWPGVRGEQGMEQQHSWRDSTPAHLVSLWSQPKPFVSRPRRSWQHCSPPWPTLTHCFPQFHPIHLLSSVLDMAYMPLELFRTVPGISSPDPWPYVINRIIKIKQVCSNISEEAFS